MFMNSQFFSQFSKAAKITGQIIKGWGWGFPVRKWRIAILVVKVQ